jgi:sirohydrochlorin cobaltochelatase
METAIVFFCHGAREASWRAPFDRVLADFRAQRPGTRADLAFLEFMSPTLPEAIDQLAGDGAQAIRVVTLFLAPGGHTRRELPEMVDAARARWPGVQFSVTPTLTESPEIRAAVVDWALARDD